MSDDPQDLINAEVSSALALNQELTDLEQQLSQNEQFRRFLELSKTVPAKLDETWKLVETQMLEHNIKKISGDWGSLTIAERILWEIDAEQLPNKFIKKVPDTKKITDTFRLEGKAPRGATAKYIKYLIKRIK